MKWDEYTKYKEDMFRLTGTNISPWVVKGNDKDLARKEALRFVLNNVNYSQKNLTNERLEPDPEIVSSIKHP